MECFKCGHFPIPIGEGGKNKRAELSAAPPVTLTAVLDHARAALPAPPRHARSAIRVTLVHPQPPLARTAPLVQIMHKT